MTVLATDSFVRSNQSGSWGTGSDGGAWTQRRSNQTLSIASNQGLMTYNGSTTLGVMTYTSQQPSSTEITFNGLATGGSDIVGGILDGDSTGNNFYHTNLGNVAGHLEIGKDVAGTFTSLGTATFSSSTNTEYSFRFQAGVTSGTLKSKVWAKSGSEPGAFMITVTDSAFSSGFFGLCAAPDAVGAAEKFDTFQATDGSSVTTTTYAFTDALTATDSLAGSQASMATDALTATDALVGSGAYSPIDALNAGDTMQGSGSASLSDALTASDALLTTPQASFADTLAISDTAMTVSAAQLVESLTASDQFTALMAAQLVEAVPASSQLSATVLAQIFEALMAADAFSSANITPTPPSSTIPIAIVFATFRSGIVIAAYRSGEQVANYRSGEQAVTYRSGEQQATYRSGVAVMGGR